MADLHLRRGLRVLCCGGAEMLDPQELQRVIKTCTFALNKQLVSLLDLELFKQSMGRRCLGSYTRLVRATKSLTTRDEFKLEDIIDIGPRKLLAVENLGDRSILAAKKALDDQLKPKELPLPISWQIPPSFYLIKAWDD